MSNNFNKKHKCNWPKHSKTKSERSVYNLALRNYKIWPNDNHVCGVETRSVEYLRVARCKTTFRNGKSTKTVKICFFINCKSFSMITKPKWRNHFFERCTTWCQVGYQDTTSIKKNNSVLVFLVIKASQQEGHFVMF